jgi:ferredoxin-NADP reductase
MISYVAEKNITTLITLIVSFSTMADMAFYESLTHITHQHPTIKIIYTLTRDLQADWPGERGRISETLIKKYVREIQKPTYYIVGFPEMVSDTEELLEGMGVSLNKIRVEPFTGY